MPFTFLTTRTPACHVRLSQNNVLDRHSADNTRRLVGRMSHSHTYMTTSMAARPPTKRRKLNIRVVWRWMREPPAYSGRNPLVHRRRSLQSLLFPSSSCPDGPHPLSLSVRTDFLGIHPLPPRGTARKESSAQHFAATRHRERTQTSPDTN